jgi:protein TonB
MFLKKTRDVLPPHPFISKEKTEHSSHKILSTKKSSLHGFFKKFSIPTQPFPYPLHLPIISSPKFKVMRQDNHLPTGAASQVIAPDFDYLHADMDEIIFQHRNKQYGAYQLRKHYDENMMKGSLIAILLLALVFYLPSIAKAMSGNKANDETLETVVVISDYIEEVKEKPLPKPEIKMPEPKKATIAFVKPKVVVDSKAHETEEVPDVADLANIEIGTKTVEGTENGVPDGLEEDLPTSNEVVASEVKQPTKPDEPFKVVEQMPAFPDGEAALFKFIAEHIKYPTLARENGLEGTVYVSFVVEKDGSITNVSIRRDIGGGCGEEAVRVVDLMPKWLPGKQRGTPVRVMFNLPIKYKLD